MRKLGLLALILPVLLCWVGTSLLAEGRAKPKTGSRKINAANALEKVNDASDTSNLGPGSDGVRVLRAQLLMDRARFSPGEVDARFGPDLTIAVKGFQERHQLPVTGIVDSAMWELLNADGEDLLSSYSITLLDLKDELVKIPADPLERAKLKRLGYETAVERFAEKFHLSEKLLAELNPGKKFDIVGQEILVPRLKTGPVARAAKVVVSKSKRTVTALAANGSVVAQYPATMGGSHDPLPIGSWKVTVVQPNPVFFYNSDRFWNSKSEAKVQMAAGPNNPAGSAWIGLSKAHYGIHGGPEPGTVRRSESYGCIRLTNWDAADLAKRVRAGTPAILEE